MGYLSNFQTTVVYSYLQNLLQLSSLGGHREVVKVNIEISFEK